MTTSTSSSKRERTPSISSKSTDGVGFNKHNGGSGGNSGNSSSSSIRKRVCKACDRCRMKKSKCDGASPCSRCKLDNAICVFGERKKTHDKVYPKGYVEMLEQQQAQLVAGMRELYRRLRTGEGWPGAWLEEFHLTDSPVNVDANNKRNACHPLTHDVLERLDLLHVRSIDDVGSPIDSHGDPAKFQKRLDGIDENCAQLQQRLIREGATMAERRRNSQPQQKREQLCHSTSEDQHRRKRSRTGSTCFGANSDVGIETDIDSDEKAQDEHVKGNAEDESEGESDLMITEPLTPDSTVSTDSPEAVTSQVVDKEQNAFQPVSQPPIFKFSNPFLGTDLSSPSAPAQAPQLVRNGSSSSGNGGNGRRNTQHDTSFNYQRHQSLPFLNQPQPLFDTNALLAAYHSNIAMTSSAIKAHSPFHTGMNPAEVLRASWAASSAATAARSSLPLSPNLSQRPNTDKSSSIMSDFLERNTSSKAAAAMFSTTTAANAAAGEQSAIGLEELENSTRHSSCSVPSLQSSLSPAPTMTAQQSIASPLTPLTPPISASASTAETADATRLESKASSAPNKLSVPGSAAAMTFTPSLTPELDVMDWKDGGCRGFEDSAGLGRLNELDELGDLMGSGGLSGFDSAGVGTCAGNYAGAGADVDVDFSRFIRA